MQGAGGKKALLLGAALQPRYWGCGAELTGAACCQVGGFAPCSRVLHPRERSCFQVVTEPLSNTARAEELGNTCGCERQTQRRF